jgi:hypothetical protein
MAVMDLVALFGALFLVGSFAQNPNCKILVPPSPLSAAGLATPYQLSALNASLGPCNMNNPAQTSFVQGVIFNMDTGAFSVYNPLVIDTGTAPLFVPTVPTLPANSIVGLWFGFNGNDLVLTDANHGSTLKAAFCVNGLPNDVFGEFAYCNAQAFFAAVNAVPNLIVIPPLGFGTDGNLCPTVRDFSVVDMDQSDNVLTAYLEVNGQTAIYSAANLANLQGQGLNPNVLLNPSDNRLIDALIDVSLGCQPWKVPDLADNNNPVSALPLNEIFAAKWATPPIALVPEGDPMVLTNGNINDAKVNLYRAGVNQPPIVVGQENTTFYCRQLVSIAPYRLVQDKALTVLVGSPMTGVASTLYAFLANRLSGAIGPFPGLNCLVLLNIGNNPINLITNNGIVTDATVNLAALTALGFVPPVVAHTIVTPSFVVTTAITQAADGASLMIQTLLLSFALLVTLF